MSENAQTECSDIESWLASYAAGETSRAQSASIARHLLACRRCRDTFADIRLGLSLARAWDEACAAEQSKQRRGHDPRQGHVRAAVALARWDELEPLLDAQTPNTMDIVRRIVRSGLKSLRSILTMRPSFLPTAAGAAAVAALVVGPWGISEVKGQRAKREMHAWQQSALSQAVLQADLSKSATSTSRCTNCHRGS